MPRKFIMKFWKPSSVLLRGCKEFFEALSFGGKYLQDELGDSYTGFILVSLEQSGGPRPQSEAEIFSVDIFPLLSRVYGGYLQMW